MASETESTTVDGNATSNDYDAVPYPGGAFPGTHISHIAMISRLCRVDVPEPNACRVLELGCAMGANLVPMAESLPNSEFVGIDLSAKQVDHGNQVIKDAGLKNIELKHLSISDVTDELGKFDYILCHGVYSWVPKEVQNDILALGKRLLTDKGVQYVSYNTLPGWNLRGVVRDMMKYHVKDLETPRERIAQARGLLEFLSKSVKTNSEAYERLLKDEAEMLKSRGDYYIYHEHLEAENEPLYFHEFVERVDAAGLRYLADTAVSTMVAQMFDDDTAELLRGVPMLQREQYMDFLRARMFRCSLICHQNVDVDYRMAPDVVEPMHVRLHQPAFEKKDADVADGLRVYKYGGRDWTTAAPFDSVVETMNDQFPGWVAVSDLVADIEDAERKQSVLESLLLSHVQGLIDLSYAPPQFCTKISEKPACNELSRTQLKYGPKVTSMLHNDFILQPQQRLLMQHMDGTNSSEQLTKALVAAVNDGQLQVTDDNGKVDSLEESFFAKIVDTELERFRALAMLAG